MIEQSNVGRPKKANPLTPKQRQVRYKSKLKKFDCKRVYITASLTERLLMKRLAVSRGLKANERTALVILLLIEEGKRQGISLKDLKREIENDDNDEK